MKVIIIGGVAGGASAAARLRRLDEKAEIIIIERSGFVSYANCGFPYYIGGVIEDKEELTIQTPESFKTRFNIDARVNQEVISIDRKNKTITIKNLLDGKIYFESYDKLVLSPGSKPFIPNILGLPNKKVFTLRTLEDTFKIDEFVKASNPKSVTIIGGGFIGLEMAENLARKNIKVNIVEKGLHLMANLDGDMASVLHNYLRKYGLKIFTNFDAKEIKEEKNQLILSSTDKTISSDFILICVGVIPESKLAKDAGLELGIKDSIKTNKYLQTSDPDIYAIGDAIEIPNYITKKAANIPLAGPANKQGRIVANNIAGCITEYHGSISSSIMKFMELTIASTGLNEKQASDAGYDFDYVVISSSSHAGYYPGASNMTMKVIFEKGSGKILGTNIIGFDGVDKRIDVLATAIHAGMTAKDLGELDLAYAPPFSSAKDPVNMVGYVIDNVVSKKINQVHWDSVENSDKAILLDVRTRGEYKRGHINYALNIPLDELRENLNKLPPNKTIYIHCQTGLRSYIACRILNQLGYKTYNISGGYSFYEQVEKDKCLEMNCSYPCDK